MSNASVEISNAAGAGSVVVASFETAGDKVGKITIAGGASQRFEKFDRLTVTAPQAAGRIRLLNHSKLALEIRHQAKSGHIDEHNVDIGGFRDLTVSPGDQLYIMTAVPQFEIPQPPLIFLARF